MFVCMWGVYVCVFTWRSKDGMNSQWRRIETKRKVFRKQEVCVNRVQRPVCPAKVQLPPRRLSRQEGHFPSP